MPRSVFLFTGPWADLPIQSLATQVSEWGYHGVELATWGDHFDTRLARANDTYLNNHLELFAQHDLQVGILAVHKVSQVISDTIDDRHRLLLPEEVWGDGQAEGVRKRAITELKEQFRLAEKLNISTVSGFTGSPIWSYVTGYPAIRPTLLAETMTNFATTWNPILDVAADHGIRFALEVHPGGLAFDLYSAELLLDAVNGRDELGFTFDPSHFHWQGIEPIEFIRRFPDRIYHVHVKDATLTLNGRAGILAGYWPSGDPRRGWQFRSPGRGGIDWEILIRGLNRIRYDGPLAVDWHDPDMIREEGAIEACRFVKSIDFDGPSRGLIPYREESE